MSFWEPEGAPVTGAPGTPAPAPLVGYTPPAPKPSGPFVDWSDPLSVISSPVRGTEAAVNAAGGLVSAATRGIPGLVASAGKEVGGDIANSTVVQWLEGHRSSPVAYTGGGTPTQGELPSITAPDNITAQLAAYEKEHPFTGSVAPSFLRTGQDVEQIARAGLNTAGRPFGVQPGGEGVGALGTGPGLLGKTALAHAVAPGGGGIGPKLLEDITNLSMLGGPLKSLVGGAADEAASQAAVHAETLKAAQDAEKAATKAASQNVQQAAKQAREAVQGLDVAKAAAAGGEPAAAAQVATGAAAVQTAMDALQQAQDAAAQAASTHASNVSTLQQLADEAQGHADKLKQHLKTVTTVSNLGSKAAASPFAPLEAVPRIAHAIVGSELGQRYLAPVVDRINTAAENASVRHEVGAQREAAQVEKANVADELQRGFAATVAPLPQAEAKVGRGPFGLFGTKTVPVADTEARTVAMMAQTGESAHLANLLGHVGEQLPDGTTFTREHALDIFTKSNPNDYTPEVLNLAADVYGKAEGPATAVEKVRMTPEEVQRVARNMGVSPGVVARANGMSADELTARFQELRDGPLAEPGFMLDRKNQPVIQEAALYDQLSRRFKEAELRAGPAPSARVQAIRDAIPAVKAGYARPGGALEVQNRRYGELAGEAGVGNVRPTPGAGAFDQVAHNLEGTAPRIEGLRQWHEAQAAYDAARAAGGKRLDRAGKVLERAVAKLDKTGLTPEELANPKALFDRLYAGPTEGARRLVAQGPHVWRSLATAPEQGLATIAQRVLDGKLSPDLAIQPLADQILRLARRDPDTLSPMALTAVEEARQAGMGDVTPRVGNVSGAVAPAVRLGQGVERAAAAGRQEAGAVANIRRGDQLGATAADRMAQPTRARTGIVAAAHTRVVASAMKLSDLLTRAQAKGAATRATEGARPLEAAGMSRQAVADEIVTMRRSVADELQAEADQGREKLRDAGVEKMKWPPPTVPRRVMNRAGNMKGRDIVRQVHDPNYANDLRRIKESDKFGKFTPRHISPKTGKVIPDKFVPDPRFFGPDGATPEDIEHRMSQDAELGATGSKFEGSGTVETSAATGSGLDAWFGAVEDIIDNERDARVPLNKGWEPGSDAAGRVAEALNARWGQDAARELSGHIVGGDPLQAADVVGSRLNDYAAPEGGFPDAGAARQAKVAAALEADRANEVNRGAPAQRMVTLYRGSDEAEVRPGEPPLPTQGSWWSTKPPLGRGGYEHWQTTEVPANRIPELKAAAQAERAGGDTPIPGRDVFLDPNHPQSSAALDAAKGYPPGTQPPPPPVVGSARAGRASLDTVGKALYDEQVAQDKAGVQGAIVGQRVAQAGREAAAGAESARTQGQAEGAILGRSQEAIAAGERGAAGAQRTSESAARITGQAPELAQQAAQRVAGPIGVMYREAGAKAQDVAAATASYLREQRALERLDEGLAAKQRQLEASVEAAPRPMRPVLEQGERIRANLTPIANDADATYGPGAGDVYRNIAAEATIMSADTMGRYGVDPQFLLGEREGQRGPINTTEPRTGGPVVGKTGQREAGIGLKHTTDTGTLLRQASRRAFQAIDNVTGDRIIASRGGTLGDMLREAGVEHPENLSHDQLIAAMKGADLAAWNLSDRRGGFIPGAQIALDTKVVPTNVWQAWQRYAETPDAQGAAGTFLKGYDKTTQFFKRLIRLTPRWQVAITTGHAVMAMAGGGFDPATYFGHLVPAAVRLDRMARTGEISAEDAAWIKTLHPDIQAALAEHGGFVPGAVRNRGFVRQQFPSGEADRALVGGRGLQLQSTLDNMHRTAVWIGKLEQGLDGRGLADFRAAYPDLAHLTDSEIQNEAAIRLSIRTMGDYLNRTPAERKVLSRIIYFYPWLKHITKLTLNTAIHDPLRTAWLLHLGAMFDPGQGPLDFLKNSYDAGNNRWITPPSWNPFEAIIPTSENPISGFNPIINTAVAGATGYDLRAGKALTRPSFESGHLNPDEIAKYAVGQSPVLKAATQVGPGLVGHEPIVRYGTGQPWLIHHQLLPSNENQIPGTNTMLPAWLTPLASASGVPQQRLINTDQIIQRQTATQSKNARARAKYERQLAASGGG